VIGQDRGHDRQDQKSSGDGAVHYRPQVAGEVWLYDRETTREALKFLNSVRNASISVLPLFTGA
jgi:hypothetical protein